MLSNVAFAAAWSVNSSFFLPVLVVTNAIMAIVTDAKMQSSTSLITQVPSVSTLVFGKDGDWWDRALLWSLAAVAVTAVAVLVATIGQIISHKREADAARFELDAYKVSVEGKVAEAKTEGITAGRAAADAVARAAEANERAAEANKIAESERLERVRLESRLAGRRLSPEQTKALIEALSSRSSNLAGLEVVRLGEREAFVYASDIIGAAMVSGIPVQKLDIGVKAPPQYGLLIEDTSDGALGKALAAAGVEIAGQVRTARNVPLLIVGLKPPY